MKAPSKCVVIVLVVLLFSATSCTRSIPVPEHDLAATTQWHGLFRVRTAKDLFIVEQFAVTDSSLVVTQLAGSDERYGSSKVPISIDLHDLQSVERLETDRGKSSLVALLVIGAGIVVWAISSLDLPETL